MSLQATYNKEIKSALKEELKLANINQVPRLEKLVINTGIGTFVKKSKDYSPVTKVLTEISGQQPVTVKAKKSVSNFKLREGQPNGVMVTLRGRRMYDFTEKLVNIVLPRLRDFRGINPNAFDGNGNYTLGLKEHIVFPEVNQDDVQNLIGIQMTFVTSAKTNEEGFALLSKLGFPFKKRKSD